MFLNKSSPNRHPNDSDVGTQKNQKQKQKQKRADPCAFKALKQLHKV